MAFLAVAAITATLVAVPQATGDPEGMRLFITGGGQLGPPGQEARFGLRLACPDAADELGEPNRLEVSFGYASRFHLTEITTADCATTDPRSGGIYRGTGLGECNGLPAMARFIFRPSADRDEHGAAIQVEGDDLACSLLVPFQPIENGSLEFHAAGGPGG